MGSVCGDVGTGVLRFRTTGGSSPLVRFSFTRPVSLVRTQGLDGVVGDSAMQPKECRGGVILKVVTLLPCVPFWVWNLPSQFHDTRHPATLGKDPGTGGEVRYGTSGSHVRGRDVEIACLRHRRDTKLPSRDNLIQGPDTITPWCMTPEILSYLRE